MVLAVAVNAQSFRVALDTTSDTQSIIAGITSTDDGGHILVLNAEQGEVQWKADATGQVEWCKRYSLSAQNRARMPDGGLVFFQMGTPEATPDTTYAHLRIACTSANGAVQWSKLLTLHLASGAQVSLGQSPIAADANGNLLVTATLENGGGLFQWFASLDADGAVLWSALYQLNFSAAPVTLLSSDGNGGWYFASMQNGIIDTFRLGRLTFTGVVAWYNSYRWYDTNGIFVYLADLTVSNGQAVVAGGLHWNGFGTRAFLMKAAFNGDIDWYRTYHPFEDGGNFDEPGFLHASALPNGELLGSGGASRDMMRLSSDGQVISGVETGTLVVQDTTYFNLFRAWDLRGGTLGFGGLLVQQNSSSTWRNYRPALWSLSPDELSGCLLEPVSCYSTLASPNEVILQSIPISALATLATLQDSATTVIDVTPYSTTDYCALVTDVPAVERPNIPGFIITTVVAQGTPILIPPGGDGAGSVEVYDINGRMLSTTRRFSNATTAIETTGWAIGLYTVAIRSLSGAYLAPAKVLLH